MSAPFPGALAVVRVQVAPSEYVASPPLLKSAAQELVDQLMAEIRAAGDGPAMVAFDTGTELDCWIRARDVITVDAVPTEDPGA